MIKLRKRTYRRYASKHSSVAGSDGDGFTGSLDQLTTLQYARLAGRLAKMSARSFWRTNRFTSRSLAVLLLSLIVFSIYYQYHESRKTGEAYNIGGKIERLLDGPIPLYEEKLVIDQKTGDITFNQDYKPGGDVAGTSAAPKITAQFRSEPENSVTVTDPVHKVGITFKPLFDVDKPMKKQNRVVYPLKRHDAMKVYTTQAGGVKEDIIFVTEPAKNEVSFEYELGLPDGLEAKIERDGSIGVYGVESTLLGNVTAGSDSDAELLKQARTNSPKTQFLFSIPAPYAVEQFRTNVSKNVEVHYELNKNILTVKAVGMHEASYPLSIDPTIYVETAQKLMRGNNETNTDFDVSNELIQKSQTTGARIDSWQGNLDMSEGIWDMSATAAGGYIYRSGGRTGITKPQILDSQTSNQGSDSTTFVMNMPATRPAGDLYIAMMCHDGTVTVSPPGGSGWYEYAETREFAAYYMVGTDQGGGNEAASYTFTGSAAETWYGVIIRVTGFDSTAASAHTYVASTGSSGSNTTPVFPTVTPVDDTTLIVRAAGADNDSPSTAAWVPSGHTKIASGNSGGANDCGFVSASLDSSPAAGVATGTATLADNTINDTYGAASLAVAPEGTVATPQIAGSQATNQASNSLTFTMNMPSTRPAGDMYIALMCKNGNNRVTPPAGGNWTEYADTQQHAAYYKIGEDKGGGNEQSTYQWTVATTAEEWYGVILRVTGIDTADPEAGTASGNSGSNATPTYPTVTPDTNKTLIIRANGIDDDVPTATGWVPGSHTKIASGTSGGGGTGDCGFTSASLDTVVASGVATGTATLGEMSDTFGSSTIAVKPLTSSTPETVDDSLDWASFNSSTLEIESPNPGDGVCDGWCNDPTYNLPEARRGHSMVAYNGYLYVIGGVDGSGNRESTVLIAKLGANGEPQLWHPTSLDTDDWEYWYTDTGLNGSTARSYLSAAAYNNRMYIMGGQTNASSGGTTTVEYADIKPNGMLGSWSTGTALPSARHGHTMHIYNDTMYLIGGNNSGTLQNSTYYVKLNSNGSMNSWVQTTSFTTARSSLGGSFTTVLGAYVYLSGGCTTVNGSGYCTAIASDTQIASINADGSLTNWGTMTNVTNSRIGYSLLGWQGGLYRIGGCTNQSASTGKCISTLADVDYGVVNPAGEVSTVSVSVASGVSPCSGSAPYNCNIPDPGDDADEGGDLLSMSTILNGYLYNIGGCIDLDCSGTSDDHGDGDDSDASGNTSYVSIGSDGTLTLPPNCTGTAYGSWCIDSTNRVNGTTGVAAGGVTTFNNRIYIVGGLTGTGQTGTIYYNDVNADGSLNGAWESTTFAAAGVTESVSYTYAYARANPSSAGSTPGNLYIFGGCGNGIGTGLSCEANAGTDRYESEVYKCNIGTTGAISGCDDSTQMEIDSDPNTGGFQGLGIHSGTVNANYIYLIGGYSDTEADKDEILIAKFDDSNNVVEADGAGTGGWTESPNRLSVGRRRGYSFGYNGHIYSVGGYDGTGGQTLPFIEWAKMDVSDGSIDEFVTSSITITQRWGLSMVVSNSYAYVIGGCDVGASPSSCSSFEPAVQTFQLYNNDSGAASDFTAQSDQTFATDTNRIGAASAVYNGYLYVAGGCTNIGCSTVTDNVQFTALSASDGTQSGSWASTTDTTLPGARAWGTLEVAGGTLYYMGGQDGTGDEKADVYYGTPSSGNVASWADSTNDIPADRTQHGSAVWNNRLYVVGGYNDSAAAQSTVYVSPQLNSGGDIGSAWSSTTSFDVARVGAAVTAYANNLYLFGGYDGTNYLPDGQFTQINSDGTVDAWTYTTSLPFSLRDARALSANGYIYLVGGRTAATTCAPKMMITPIVANTTIATGNNPTGVGEWYETNVRYGGGRYGAAVAYDEGKIYTMGGGCNILAGAAYTTGTIQQTGTTVTGSGTSWTSDFIGATITYSDASTATILSVNSTTSLTVSVSKSVAALSTYSIAANRHFNSTVRSQPQVAIYSRMIDTDTDVYPNSWLMNGLDNSIGARWQVRYRSMNDTDGVATDCGTADMSTWGQETVYGDVTLGDVAPYVPRDGSNNDIDCARYFYFYVSIDASKTFGYPEDVNRGPTIADLSLFFTSDPSKRMRHGKTFTGGEQQPLDTPCRQSADADCPLP